MANEASNVGEENSLSSRIPRSSFKSPDLRTTVFA